MVSSESQGGPGLSQSLRSVAPLGAGIVSWADSSSGSRVKEPQLGQWAGSTAELGSHLPPLTVTWEALPGSHEQSM